MITGIDYKHYCLTPNLSQRWINNSKTQTCDRLSAREKQKAHVISNMSGGSFPKSRSFTEGKRNNNIQSFCVDFIDLSGNEWTG